MGAKDTEKPEDRTPAETKHLEPSERVSPQEGFHARLGCYRHQAEGVDDNGGTELLSLRHAAECYRQERHHERGIYREQVFRLSIAGKESSGRRRWGVKENTVSCASQALLGCKVRAGYVFHVDCIRSIQARLVAAAGGDHGFW